MLFVPISEACLGLSNAKCIEKGLVMESVQSISSDERQNLLETWLVSYCGFERGLLEPLVKEASFRRYFRFITAETSYIVMDAPPDIEKNTFAFVSIAKTLHKLGLQVPEIFFADITQGFLVLTDFGDASYLRMLTPINADKLYKNALDNLIKLQQISAIPDYHLARFDRAFMQSEWALCKEWFIKKYLNISTIPNEVALDNCFEMLITSAEEQPQKFMHRDFISTNLMLLKQDAVGILDFQDAFIGPVTYDVVSLLRDCYINWPEDKVIQWVLYYKNLLEKNNLLHNIKEQEFVRWVDLMGIERHLKVLVTFSRKHFRDADSRYLKYIPRTFNYLINVSKKYQELSALREFLLLHTSKINKEG